MYISMGSSLIWVVSFKIYVSPLGTMLFPMSETFKKSQLSEFFDVSSRCKFYTRRFPDCEFFSVFSVNQKNSAAKNSIKVGHLDYQNYACRFWFWSFHLKNNWIASKNIWEPKKDDEIYSKFWFALTDLCLYLYTLLETVFTKSVFYKVTNIS